MSVISLSYSDPMLIFSGFADDVGVVFLNSATPHHGAGRYSYIAVDPIDVVRAERTQYSVSNGSLIGATQDARPFHMLERILHNYRAFSVSSPVPFCGGAIGAFSYELGSSLEKLPEPKKNSIDLPLMHLGIYDTFIAFDIAEKNLWVVGADDRKTRSLADRVVHYSKEKDSLDRFIQGQWRAEQTKEEALKNIRAIIDYIYAGDILQANYTQKFIAERPYGLDDATIYRRLCALTPAPFSAFMRWNDIALASASPERFLRLKAAHTFPDRTLEAWPIKGTRPRHSDPIKDGCLAEELKNSSKDHAENLMIVDLMRNDLARVCDIGSIKVSRLYDVETFASVHHLVSYIEGRLKIGLGPVDALRATFPGGSITGTPKIRAMEIIHELEPSPRGFYCGCLGWIGFDGAMDMSMTIRTLTMTRDKIIAQAGGGIVADSNPESEYDECMTKIAPLLETVAGAVK